MVLQAGSHAAAGTAFMASEGPYSGVDGAPSFGAGRLLYCRDCVRGLGKVSSQVCMEHPPSEQASSRVAAGTVFVASEGPFLGVDGAPSFGAGRLMCCSRDCIRGLGGMVLRCGWSTLLLSRPRGRRREFSCLLTTRGTLSRLVPVSLFLPVLRGGESQASRGEPSYGFCPLVLAYLPHEADFPCSSPALGVAGSGPGPFPSLCLNADQMSFMFIF